uniref:Uncharacterized protein n=1 Tax=Spongospora subterranea TaxID=70186 RepID=A0A0H5R7F3_9EUKA|eukprot:CRZ10080.1 hypothetical protein [Spongospora subterranea]
MSNEWRQNDPEMAKCMLNFLLDELQPQLWTKKKDAIATFTSYYFRSFPAYDDDHIRTMYMGDSTRRGLLQACGQISWKSFRIKTSSIRSLDLLVDLLDDIKNRESSSFTRVFLSLDDAAFKAMKLDKLVNLKETKAKATVILNLLQSNGRQIPVSDADDPADALEAPSPSLALGLAAPRQLQGHRDSVMVATPKSAAYIPAPLANRSQFTALMTKLGNLLSRRPNISTLVEKGIVQTPQAFGRPLVEVISRSNIDGVPSFLVRCCDYLRENAFDKVGVFRVSGEQAEVFRLKHMIDYSTELTLDNNISPHSVAGVVKLWIRELPEPLLTFKLYDAMVKSTRSEKWADLDSLEASLPKPNLTIFRYLCMFLAEVSQKSDVNKMTPSNLAIVFAPNLIRPVVETFEAIARDTPVTIATIRYFVDKACQAVNESVGKAASVSESTSLEASSAPLPENWTVYLDETTGAPFFYNTVTNESCWDRPSGQNSPSIDNSTPSKHSPSTNNESSIVPVPVLDSLPLGWEEFQDDKTGVPYYYNKNTDECSWVHPKAAAAGESARDPFESVHFDNLEFAHFVAGKWDSNSAGGCYPEVTWFKNPQWRINMVANCPATLRINCACTSSMPMGVHIINVSATGTTDLSRVLSVAEDQILSIGPFQEKKDALQIGMSEIKINGPISVMIIPATNVPGVVDEFRFSVSCTSPISISEIMDTNVWHKTTAVSQWESNTAGGCYPNFSTWRNNNQFTMLLANPTVPFHALIHLERLKKEPDCGAIGIYVLHNNGPAKEKLGVSDGEVLARSEFVTASDIVVELALPANTCSAVNDPIFRNIMVVPCTYEPEVFDKFTLTVFSDQPIKLLPVTERWFSTPAIASGWTPQNSGGCRNYETWQSNPSFALTSSEGTGPESFPAMCIISQPNPEKILPIGFYVTDVHGKTRCKGTFSLAPEVFGQMVFKPEEAPYTLIACTFNPGLTGDFKAQIFSERRCLFQETSQVPIANR